jgi:RHS repeat-associated protein
MVTKFTNLATGANDTQSAQYDIFGNTIEVQMSCCNQKTYTYGDDTYYSQPDTTTSGGSGGPTLSNNAAYDFGTSAVTSTTDADGLTTSYTEDGWLNPTQIEPPSGESISLGYDDFEGLDSESVSYSDGGVSKSFSSSTTKDGWGNAIQGFDPAGNQINMSYDSMGRLLSQTNPFVKNGTPAPATTYQYDPLGRQIVTTLPDGNTLTVTYNGSTITLTDEVGRQVQRIYDGLGRLITVNEQNPSTGALTQTTTYTYNYLDKLIKVNQSGQVRSWNYDALGEMTYENIPEQTAMINDGTGTMWTSAYTYTDFGALATKTDARGVVKTNTYDTMNRLISTSYNTSNAPGVASTPTVAYNYDNSTDSTQGELLSVSVGSYYSESYSYDASERPASITDTINGEVYKTSYQYNQANQVTQVTYPSTRVLPYSHDSFGRLISIGAGTAGNGSIGYLASITYSAAGQTTGYSLGNGVAETFNYSPNRLQMNGVQATAGGATLMNLTYNFIATAGQLGMGTTAGDADQAVGVSGTINGQTESAAYTYDLDRRLVTASQTSNGQTGGRSYTWDPLGNRLTETDTVANAQIQSLTLAQSGGVTTNQISSVNNSGQNFSYTYDASGNVTSDGSGNTYTYDGENRLVSVSGSASIQNSYDFKNRRVINTESGATTHYIWQGNQVLAEMNGANGSLQIDYILYGKSFIAKIQASGVVSYFLSDRLSERLRLDSSANVQGIMGTLPWGEDFAETGTQEKHHFTTYDRDPTTGADYAINRMYSSSMGRFTRVDPKASSADPGTPRTWNRYAYVAGDPVNSTDPTGLECHEEWVPNLGGDGGHWEVGCTVGDGGDGPPYNPTTPDSGGAGGRTCAQDLDRMDADIDTYQGTLNTLFSLASQANPSAGKGDLKQYNNGLALNGAGGGASPLLNTYLLGNQLVGLLANLTGYTLNRLSEQVANALNAAGNASIEAINAIQDCGKTTASDSYGNTYNLEAVSLSALFTSSFLQGVAGGLPGGGSRLPNTNET